LIIRDEAIKDACRALGATEDLIAFDGVASEVLQKLCEAGIKTLNDFADLAGDEVLEIIGNDLLTLDEANEAIMKARASWFDESK
jgi:N utilization substance protein A